MKYLQKVKCKARLRRKYSFYETHIYTWVKVMNDSEGVVIGQRTLSNGIVEYDPEYTAFIPKEYIKAYLVSYSMNENPVYVLPEDIEIK